MFLKKKETLKSVISVFVAVCFTFSCFQYPYAVALAASLESQPISKYLATRVADSGRGIGLVEKESSSTQVQLGKYWAVLIGIEEYDHWPNLSTPVNDTRTLEALLKERYGFNPNRVKTITDKDATRQGILDAFKWLVRNVGENDNVLIFYAGHGELDNTIKTGYWIPVESRKDKEAAYIENSTIRNYISAMKAKHVFLIADSCFSGSLFAGKVRSKPPIITGRYFQEVYNRKSRQGLTSGGTEPVSDDGYENHSIFAYYLLKALSGNKAPFLTASSLFEQISVPVANNSRQTPVNRPIKDAADEGGEFLFALGGKVSGLEVDQDIITKPMPWPDRSEPAVKASKPWYKRWYVWTIVGAIIAGVAASGSFGGGSGGAGGGTGGGGG